VQRYTNQLENTMKIRTTRRTLARVKTILAARAKGIDKKRAPAAEAAEAKE
jgi:ribosomal protein L29